MLEIPQLVEIINKCGLSGKKDIKKILNMTLRNYIRFDVVNKISLREDTRNKIYQTYKYRIPKNSAYYVNHDWDKNHKVRGGLASLCPWYGNNGCSFKLIVQKFIYKIIPNKKKRVFRSNLMWFGLPLRWWRRNLIWLKIQKMSQWTGYH